MEVQKDATAIVPLVERRTEPRRREDRLQLRWERQLYAARRICEALFQRTNIDDLIQNTLHTALDVIGQAADQSSSPILTPNNWSSVIPSERKRTSSRGSPFPGIRASRGQSSLQGNRK